MTGNQIFITIVTLLKGFFVP